MRRCAAGHGHPAHTAHTLKTGCSLYRLPCSGQQSQRLPRPEAAPRLIDPCALPNAAESNRPAKQSTLNDIHAGCCRPCLVGSVRVGFGVDQKSRYLEVTFVRREVERKPAILMNKTRDPSTKNGDTRKCGGTLPQQEQPASAWGALGTMGVGGGAQRRPHLALVPRSPLPAASAPCRCSRAPPRHAMQSSASAPHALTKISSAHATTNRVQQFHVSSSGEQKLHGHCSILGNNSRVQRRVSTRLRTQQKQDGSHKHNARRTAKTNRWRTAAGLLMSADASPARSIDMMSGTPFRTAM